MPKNVILGAGITGISTALFLKVNYSLFEQDSKVGGVSGSEYINGYTFDYGEHFIRFPDKLMEEFFKKIMGDEIEAQELKSAIYFKKKYINYPFQENLRDLPPEDLHKCAKDLIKSFILNQTNSEVSANFEDYIRTHYGSYISNNFMIPYNRKIWTIEPNKMSTNWFLNPNFIPKFDLDQILHSILPKVNNIEEKSKIRWYSKSGGSFKVAKKFAENLKHINLNSKATLIDTNEKWVEFENGSKINYDYLISTIPLLELLEIIKDIPLDIMKKSKELKYNSVICINFCLKHEKNFPYHWIYFPQNEFPFSRLFFTKNFSIGNVPNGKDACSALITYNPEEKINEKEIIEETLNSIIKIGIIKNENEIENIYPTYIKYGFTIPTLDLDSFLNPILKYLRRYNIHSIGRYGEWKYSGIEHAILDGQKMAKFLNSK